MGDRHVTNFDHLPPELQDLSQRILALAHQRQGNEFELLELLRLLEYSHAHIRETWFQESLPTNRHGLYALLREIETQGGWPYIKRMSIRALLAQLDQDP